MSQLIVPIFLLGHVVAGLWLSLRPNWRPGEELFVLFDPRLDPSQILRAVAEAEGQIVRGEGPAMVVRSDAPGFLAALFDRGALLTLNPIVEGACAALL